MQNKNTVLNFLGWKSYRRTRRLVIERNHYQIGAKAVSLMLNRMIVLTDVMAAIFAKTNNYELVAIKFGVFRNFWKFLFALVWHKKPSNKNAESCSQSAFEGWIVSLTSGRSRQSLKNCWLINKKRQLRTKQDNKIF